MIDLDAYLQRIDWQGTVRTDLDTLTGLLGAHMRAIPFENLDVLLGRRIDLGLASLQQKLVQARRGGYCFEHVTLFAAAMGQIGFRVSCHLARVVLAAPKTESSRTHMFALVHLPEGRFVADPGFGGPASVIPLPLIETEQRSAHNNGDHWFAREQQDWILRTRSDGMERDLWVSELATDYPIDFELSNYFVATHDSSIFKTNIMLNLFTEKGRISVINRDVTLWDGEERSTWRLADYPELRRLLLDRFTIALPADALLDAPAFVIA
ncbi:arylamine N-acetyltransferase family protein [Martelella alba]|nr:arylamine N-acetyltransferase [Martelella alba]